MSSLLFPLTSQYAIPDAMKTRERVCGVKMWFQGVRVNLPGYGIVSNPGGFTFSLDANGRAAVREVEKSHGTHCLRQLSYAYTSGGYTYPIPGADFTKKVDLFRALLLEDIRAGLTPIVELAGDGQSYDPNGGTYGFGWLRANLPRILSELGPDVCAACLFFHCWESVNYGGWSPDNLFEMTLLHRQLDPHAKLAWHFSYAWPGDASGGQLGPVGEWSSPAGMACDVMLAEGDAPFIHENGQTIKGDALNGWQQRASAWLGPFANNNEITPDNRRPYYWPNNTPRGPRYAVAFELDEFRDDRGAVTLGEIEAERAYIRKLGIQFVC